jgi:hypothetical protein
MALRIELWESGRLIDGVEEWWDGVEAALAAAEDAYPLLDGVSPYGDFRVAPDRLRDLAVESRALAATTTGSVRTLLLKLGDLSDRAASATDAELRFNGD